MKKRNKHFEALKKFNALTKRQNEIWDIQRNQNWIKLDKPIHRGWDAKLILREDIARRDDAHIFQYIIDTFGVKKHSPKKQYFIDTRIKSTKNNIFSDRPLPYIKCISERQYNSLEPRIKKYFSLSQERYSWGYNNYCCNIPSFYFDIRITKHWVTHYKEHDNVLEQEEAEIDKALGKFKHLSKWNKYKTAPKNCRKKLNQLERVKSKRVVKAIFNDITSYSTINNYLTNSDIETEFVFSDNYRGAAWHYW